MKQKVSPKPCFISVSSVWLRWRYWQDNRLIQGTQTFSLIKNPNTHDSSYCTRCVNVSNCTIFNTKKTDVRTNHRINTQRAVLLQENNQQQQQQTEGWFCRRLFFTLTLILLILFIFEENQSALSVNTFKITKRRRQAG